MTKGYLTTAALCKRFGCSSRTLYRWMSKENNPMPAPAMRPSGSHNMWAIEDIEAWEERERAANAVKAA